MTNDGREFGNRIQLVHEARQYKEIFGDVLKCLAQGKGSNDIVAMLLNHNNSQSKVLLHAIEKNRVAFTSEQEKHPYSYYAMYIVLHNPLIIFQSLQFFETISLHRHIVRTWLKMYTHPLGNINNNNPLFEYDLSIDRLIEIIEEKNYITNKEEFQSEVKGSLAQNIGEHLKATFDKLTWGNQTNQANVTPASLFSEICTPTKNEFHLHLDFDAAKLSSMINLGQIDSLMEGIKTELLKAHNNNLTHSIVSCSSHSNFAGAIDELSKWYKCASTGLIKKIESVPSLIASLLEFDLLYRKGMASEGFGFIRIDHSRKKLTTRDCAKVVTGIIHHTLFKAANSYDLQKFYLSGPSVDHYFEALITAVENLAPQSKLMKPWANPEHGPMIEKFKKLPSYLKPQKNYEKIRNKINQQQRLSRDEAIPYPIYSLFPFPLWVEYVEKTH